MQDAADRPDRTIIRQTLLVAGVLLALGMVIGLLFIARHLLMLIFGAVLMAVVINHLADWLGSFFKPDIARKVRVAAILLTMTLVTGLGIYLFAHSASEQMVQWSKRIDESFSTVTQAAKEQPLLAKLMDDQKRLMSVLPSSAESLGFAKNIFATAFGAVADVLIIVILSAYFCISPAKYRDGAIRMVPLSWREPLSELLSDSGDTLWRWMLGRLLSMVVVGVVFAVGLALLGVPMPVELGLFAAVVTFIPNIGAIAAVIPALLLAANQGSGAALGVLGLYVAIQFTESYLLTPLVQQKQVALPPALVILSQVVAGLVFGFWGIVFATPLMAIVALWIRRLYVEGFIEASPTGDCTPNRSVNGQDRPVEV